MLEKLEEAIEELMYLAPESAGDYFMGLFMSAMQTDDSMASYYAEDNEEMLPHLDLIYKILKEMIDAYTV